MSTWLRASPSPRAARARARRCGSCAGGRGRRPSSASDADVRPAHAELPMTRPLNTEVIANETPVTVPTMPLARSRRSSGTSSVTHVDRAMPRICPATEPSSVTPTSTQNHGLRRRSRSLGVDGEEHDGRDDEAARRTSRWSSIIGVVLAVAVDVGAEERAEHGRGDAERAADHAGGDDRAGLEVHPERQREPQERAGHAADQRVDQQPVEDPHRSTDATGEPNSSGGNRFSGHGVRRGSNWRVRSPS